MANKQHPLEKKTGPISDIEDDDYNQTGHQHPTQKNEGRRTPTSRSDREAKVGGNNQGQSRRGARPDNAGGG